MAYKIATNRIKKTVTLQPILKADGQTTTSIEETVTEIMRTLYQIGEDHDKTEEINVIIQTDNMSNNTSALNIRQDDDIPFSEEEISHTVRSLKKLTAPGPDNISTSFLRTLYNKHKQTFHFIFNTAFKLKYFPMAWRKARVILIPKQCNNQQMDANKFRPLAINSIFGKIYEKLLYQRIYHHLHSKKLIPSNQYGFTHGKSAIHAINKIKITIEKAKLDKLKTAIVSLDIKNAFGSINTTAILRELGNLKLPYNLIQITKHLVHKRKVI